MRLSKKNVLVFVLLSLAAYMQSPVYAAALSKNYVSARYSYSIKFPADYKIKISGNKVIFVSPVEDKKLAFSPSVNVVSSELDKNDTTDLDALCEKAKNGIIKGWGNAEFIEQKKEKLNGFEVYRFVSTSKQQKANFKLMQVLLLNNKKIYVLTYTALESQYNGQLGVARAIIGSFKITK
ncbi:MAG: PsbP-related protein [Candidatus Omnitrophica bacterium]|nr:hypothetical protein [Candidatus Omnitrophota bacterium]MDD5079837.1 PsbP-related protein [Candidatus Omnitrophota bacterium]